jgi:hypothetical protein
VLNAHHVTSMADTDIDAVRKQNKTYTWSGTSIIKDGRYTLLCTPCICLQLLSHTLTHLHTNQNIRTFLLQLPTTRHICCDGNAATDVPAANGSASHPGTTLIIVMLVLGECLVVTAGLHLQQPTPIVIQCLSIVPSGTMQLPSSWSY